MTSKVNENQNNGFHLRLSCAENDHFVDLMFTLDLKSSDQDAR